MATHTTASDAPDSTKPPVAATGAGTSAPKLGAPDFDADNANADDLEEHVRLLTARKALALLTAIEPVATVATTVAAPDPTDIVAVHATLGQRRFTQITWDAMEEKGEHAGWQVEASKPSKLAVK